MGARFHTSIFLLALSVIGYSQSFEDFRRQANEDFLSFRDEAKKEFEAYRTQVNSEFADFMRKAWSKFDTHSPEPVPPSPEPPKPVVADPSEPVTTDPLPFAKITSTPKPLSSPEPLLPSSPLEDIPRNFPTPAKQPNIPAKPTTPQISFDFYGSPCTIPFDKSLRIQLRGIDENSVADAWEALSSKKSVELIEGAIAVKDKLKLNDGGYLRFVEKLSEAIFPNNKNEAKLLQMFILTQSGYKVRLGRQNNNLVLMVPSDDRIYNYSFIIIDNHRFYIIDNNKGLGSTYVYNRRFPREQMFSMAFNSQPSLDVTKAPKKSFRSLDGSGVEFEISVNKNLIDFYNDYPLTSDWNIYANASLSEDVKDQLYPILRQAIEGKSEKDGANLLLHFVQKAFEYKTDGEQFGYERSFFPDETFFYPYSDCEDRAILFSVLVRELLDLEVVLLYYPGHLATAVQFNDSIKGDYVTVDGKTYTICDPTYINSNVGMSMPRYKKTSAEIVKL